MEATSSHAQSFCSTTAIAIEDDANSVFVDDTNGSGIYDSSGYTTPQGTSNLPYCGSEYEPDCDAVFEPSIGMIFDSWEEGEKFYKSYSLHVGFAVRTGSHKLSKEGVVLWKRFTCTREGWRKSDKTVVEDVKGKRKRNVNLSRCGCGAMIGFKRKDDGRYEVARFLRTHTHHFVSPDKRHLMRSNRDVSSEVRSSLFSCQKACIGTSATYRLLSVQKGGHENIGCTKRDLQNHERDFKSAIKSGDGEIFINLLKKRQSGNPTFFFEYELDDKNRLEHVFWADSTCRKNYALFGEILSFDATYKTNRYDMVFAPFTGVNHHKSCVTFGAAFIPHEKIESYVWVFETFLKAMGGVAPKIIITDEDLSMKAAIKKVFPNTIHRLCMWHILNKVKEKVGGVLNSDLDFRSLFQDCVWGSETPEEFETNWAAIVSKYSLENNEWLSDKFKLRESWIPAYFRDVTLGGILRTTSRSESENAFFNHFTHRRLALLEFWIRFETAIDEQRHKELENDHSTIHTDVPLKAFWGIERHARDLYTHTIFILFQDQVLIARDHCDVETIELIDDVRTTWITDGSSRSREVHYNTSTKDVQCSCRLFESIGIICSHIIVVLKKEKIMEIPCPYIMERWTKMSIRKNITDVYGNVLGGSSTCLPPTIKMLYSETCSKFNSGLMAAKHCEQKMMFLHKAVADAVGHVLQMGEVFEQSKNQEFESFIGTAIPENITIHPPPIAHTKGNGYRFRRGSEGVTTSKSTKKGPRSSKGVKEK